MVRQSLVSSRSERLSSFLKGLDDLSLLTSGDHSRSARYAAR
jgi:hypothetical protein